jgi:Xaa-Pro dipeptidase
MNQKRLSKVLNNMESYGLDQIVITSPEAIFYLLEEWIHPGERMLALYLNSRGEARMFINALFPINRDLGVELKIYNDTQDPIKFLSEIVDENQVCGIDKEWPSHFLIRLLKKKPSLRIEVGSIAIDMSRMIKDEEEIELMRKASEVNDKGMGELVELLKAGDYSEAELGKKLGEIYARYNTKDFSFTPLIMPQIIQN